MLDIKVDIPHNIKGYEVIMFKNKEKKKDLESVGIQNLFEDVWGN